MSDSEDVGADGGGVSRPLASTPVDESGPHQGHVSQHGQRRLRHTRTSAAWVSIVVAVIFGIALIDFIAQNTRDVRIDFFSVSGRMPVAVALLVAALAGAIVVTAVGVGRLAQLRLSMRRERRQHEAERDNKN